MSGKILWLDNDLTQVKPYLETLREEGYLANVVSTVTEAESLLKHEHYDLFILDVQIPTKNSDEEKRFPPDKTEYGRKLGLYFFLEYKEKLQRDNTQILVLTQRVDWDIRDGFIKAGLQSDQFCTKFALRDVEVFLTKVKLLLENSTKM